MYFEMTKTHSSWPEDNAKQSVHGHITLLSKLIIDDLLHDTTKDVKSNTDSKLVT